MRHHAQASSVVFVKKNMEDLPTTMDELQNIYKIFQIHDLQKD
jgi:hypothetical protein